MKNYIKGLVLLSGIAMFSLYGMEQVPYGNFELGKEVEVHFTTNQGQKKTAHFRRVLKMTDIYGRSPATGTNLLAINIDGGLHDFIVTIDKNNHAKLVGVAIFWGASEEGHIEVPTSQYIDQAQRYGFDVSEFKGNK